MAGSIEPSVVPSQRITDDRLAGALSRIASMAESETSAALHHSVLEFEEHRQADRMAYLHVVRTLGITLLSISVVTQAVANLLYTLGFGQNEVHIGEWEIFQNFCWFMGAVCLAGAAVALSSTPVRDLDIDSYAERRPKLFVLWWMCVLFLSIIDRLPVAAATCVFAAMCIGLRGYMKVPFSTTLMNCWLILFMIETVFKSARSAFYDQFECDATALHLKCLAGSGTIGSMFMVFAFGRFKLCESNEDAQRSLVFIRLVYYGLATRGLAELATSVATLVFPTTCFGMEMRWYQSISYLFRGLSYICPPLVVVCVGRDRVFNILAQRFDRDPERAKRGGAFMAALLDNVPIMKGDIWWIHHGNDDKQYVKSDPRRNWQRGKVVSVSDTEFVVRFRHPFPLGQASENAQRSNRLDASSGLVRGLGRAFTFGFGSTLSDYSYSSRVKTESSYRTIPLGLSATSPESLLRFAQQELRCIEWSQMSKDLIAKSSGGSFCYKLGRPVRPREEIDFFLSHSWHDNHEAKWEALTKTAEWFYRATKRWPTFWLDKVCIDQERIRDGLRVLPVNVMACRQVLVLCGETYPTRLWCMWELVTLFSLLSKEDSSRRVNFVPLDDDGGSAAMQRIANFRLRQAHCYDPNEESKLRRVIYAVGVERFNNQVRHLLDELTPAPGSRTFTSTVVASEPSDPSVAAELPALPEENVANGVGNDYGEIGLRSGDTLVFVACSEATLPPRVVNAEPRASPRLSL